MNFIIKYYQNICFIEGTWSFLIVFSLHALRGTKRHGVPRKRRRKGLKRYR